MDEEVNGEGKAGNEDLPEVEEAEGKKDSRETAAPPVERDTVMEMEATKQKPDDEKPPEVTQATSDSQTDAPSTGTPRVGGGRKGSYTPDRGSSGPSRSGGPMVGSNSKQRKTYFRRKVCRLCVNKIREVDYKDVDLLRRFITDRGKILPRRMTGTCARHQRVLSGAIKRARMAALVPFVRK